MDTIRSEKEAKLLKFFEDNRDKDITIEIIQKSLGEPYVGCLGKLLKADKIEKGKKRLGERTTPYGTFTKLLKCFKLKEVKAETTEVTKRRSCI